MIGIGLFILAFGYAVVYWGINAIHGKSQGDFISYIFPFGKGSQLGLSLNPPAKPPAGIKGPITAADVAKMKNKVKPVATPHKGQTGR
jgi:hypothetical protein